ncbi:hypothetical protein EJB05_57891, partial [Eragrostis curvula]
MDASVRFLIRFIFHVYLLSPHAVLLPGIKLAMQLRSGRRLVSPPPAPRGDLRRVRPRRIQEDGDAGEDRISSLPDELLLDVLRRLGCAREAARTSVLSHRWSVLWTELRELSIAAVAADAVAELTLVRSSRPPLYQLPQAPGPRPKGRPQPHRGADILPAPRSRSAGPGEAHPLAV